MVNNLNDGMAWALLPLFSAARGLDLRQIAIVTAAYPAVRVSASSGPDG